MQNRNKNKFVTEFFTEERQEALLKDPKFKAHADSIKEFDFSDYFQELKERAVKSKLNKPIEKTGGNDGK